MFHIISKYKMLHLFKVPLFLIIIVSVIPSADAKICYDIDARNDPAEIELRLRNCTIVVGSVSILLIERHRDVFNFTSLQFPELQWDIFVHFFDSKFLMFSPFSNWYFIDTERSPDTYYCFAFMALKRFDICFQIWRWFEAKS